MCSKMENKLLLNSLKKYWIVAKVSWINGFTYLTSFVMFRVRQIIQVVVAFSLWEAIFASTITAFGYTSAQMFTYIFAASIIGYVVTSSRTIDVAGVIHSGDLSLYLVKPLNFFLFWFSRDVADKLQNVIFSAIELAVLFFIFHPTLYIPTHISTIFLTLFTVGGAMVMFFLINTMFGLLGFWTPDVWAPRFLFYTIMFFTAGSFFPLDIFPNSIVQALSYTPFPYVIFFPTKVLLEQLSSVEVVRGILFTGMWVGLCGLGVFTMWKKGVHSYEAEGRGKH